MEFSFASILEQAFDDKNLEYADGDHDNTWQ